MVEVLGHENGFPDSLFAGEMVINAAHGDTGFIDNLAHGRGMVALLHEKLVSRLDDPGAGGFSLGVGCIVHT